MSDESLPFVKKVFGLIKNFSLHALIVNMNLKCLNLKFPPRKYPTIPERLIYGSGKTYNMASTKTGHYLARLKVTPMELKENSFYRNEQPIKSLYINDLNVCGFTRRNNVGTDFVNFAKILSRKKNCEGRLHLLAYNYDNPGKAPHKFWRKLGFASVYPEENKILDFIIENNLLVPPNMCQGTMMFLEKWNV